MDKPARSGSELSRLVNSRRQMPSVLVEASTGRGPAPRHSEFPYTSFSHHHARHRDMTQQLDARGQMLALLAQGWRWRDPFSDVLVHPADHGLSVTYDRAEDT